MNRPCYVFCEMIRLRKRSYSSFILEPRQSASITAELMEKFRLCARATSDLVITEHQLAGGAVQMTTRFGRFCAGAPPGYLQSGLGGDISRTRSFALRTLSASSNADHRRHSCSAFSPRRARTNARQSTKVIAPAQHGRNEKGLGSLQALVHVARRTG